MSCLNPLGHAGHADKSAKTSYIFKMKSYDLAFESFVVKLLKNNLFTFSEGKFAIQTNLGQKRGTLLRMIT